MIAEITQEDARKIASLLYSINVNLCKIASHRLLGYTVDTLPTGTQGDVAFVTDSSTSVFLDPVVGGGAIVTPVFFDGADWVVG